MGQETPGLRSRKRKGGAEALYWCATAEAVKAGFMPRTVNLSMHRENPVLLSRACKRLDAEQIVKARAQAHKKGHPGLALAYAIQFETTLRLWDVVGKWVPVSEPGISPFVSRGQKWFGLTWADIDENLILRTTPSKTINTTQTTVAFDLSLCPMVMEEIAKIPAEERSGPLVKTGAKPYPGHKTKSVWREIADEIGMAGVWNRDIRAGGITDARQAGANLDDVSKAAGHAGKAITARVYDRDTLEHHRRVRRTIAGTRSGTRDNAE